MRQLVTIVATGMLFFSAGVSAHTHLASSIPANNAQVTKAPEQIVLVFDGSVQLTAVSVEAADGKSKIAITPLPSQKIKETTLPAPKLSNGAHVIVWRAVGDDGHVMSGKVKFTVAAP
jgi:methionine-rich copper-binding protein CopC